jgi:hypothetical protein
MMACVLFFAGDMAAAPTGDADLSLSDTLARNHHQGMALARELEWFEIASDLELVSNAKLPRGRQQAHEVIPAFGPPARAGPGAGGPSIPFRSI